MARVCALFLEETIAVAMLSKSTRNYEEEEEELPPPEHFGKLRCKNKLSKNLARSLKRKFLKEAEWPEHCLTRVQVMSPKILRKVVGGSG